jgi:hypothetical protein
VPAARHCLCFQVLYLTYQNLLMIASGILVNEHQQEQAQKLHDKDAKGRIAPTLQNLDASSSSSSSSDIGPRAKVDQVWRAMGIST